MTGYEIVQKALYEDFGINEFDPSKSLSDYDIDSIEELDLFIAIEQDYKITLLDDRLESLENIQGLIDYIDEILKES